MRTLSPLCLLLATLAVGCAHTPHTRPADLAAKGPGSTFATVEAAAIDALTWAHLEGRKDGLVSRVRAGTIEVGDGGYTYRTVVVASRRDPHRVRLEIGPKAVAHFRSYTRDRETSETLIVNHVRERPSRSLRRLVDRVDSLHRPAFILTPSLRVRVYRGRDEGTLDVANLRGPAAASVIADSR